MRLDKSPSKEAAQKGGNIGTGGGGAVKSCLSEADISTKRYRPPAVASAAELKFLISDGLDKLTHVWKTH